MLESRLPSVSLFESQAIAGFLIALGRTWAAKNPSAPIEPNYWDGRPENTWGDMTAGVGGKFWLIEFKRRLKAFSTETGKSAREAQLAALDRAGVMDLADRGHVAGIADSNNRESIVTFYRYWPLHTRGETTPNLDTQEFLQAMFSDRSPSGPMEGLPKDEFSHYLDLLDNHSGSAPIKHDITGALVIAVVDGRVFFHIRTTNQLGIRCDIAQSASHPQMPPLPEPRGPRIDGPKIRC